MNKKMFIILVLTIIMLCVFACGKTDNKEQSSVNNTSNISNTQSANLSGTVPDELEYITYPMDMKIRQHSREHLINLHMIHGSHSVMSKNLIK